MYIWFNTNEVSWHDLSISIIYLWKVYALEFERILKIKHYSYTNTIFWYSLEYIIDLCTSYLFDSIKFDTKPEIFVINNNNFKYKWFEINLIDIEKHHLFHACSAFYPSWFTESAVLTLDFFWWDIVWNKKHGESQVMWYFEWNKYKKIYSWNYLNGDFNSWIGGVYKLFCQLIWLDEWSIMWLSSYWDYKKYSNIKLFEYDWDNVFLNKDIEFTIKSNITNQFLIAEQLKNIYWLQETDYVEKFNNSESIITSKFADIAAHLQYEVEKAIVYLANSLYSKVKCKNLCLAWWVALNILANTKILEKTPFENIFIQPAANDWWISLWAAYYWYHIHWWNLDKIQLNSAWLWLSYDQNKILNKLKYYSDYLQYEYSDNIEWVVADLLSKWNIIWWFQWRSEFWPRSLWFRSILADSRSISIRDRVNKIKDRQSWRPLAPVILEEDLNDYFLLGIKSPYMTFSSNIVDSKKQFIPWIVHVDWTARFQTVNKQENELYYNLIKEFKKNTWIPILINTSFNVSWQAIVENPDDAIKTFLSTELDYLIIWNFIVSKTQIYNKFKFNKYKHIFNLSFVDKEKQKLFFKNRIILKRIFFRGNYDVTFMFKVDLNFYFTITILDKKYIIILCKINEEENNWSYFKYNNIYLKVDIELDYKENFSSELVVLLNYIKEVVTCNYNKINEMFIL